jgi:hypothetical protein
MTNSRPATIGRKPGSRIKPPQKDVKRQLCTPHHASSERVRRIVPCKIAAVVGGIREDSINRKLASALIKLMPSDLEGALRRIDDLPVFNQENPPEPVKRVRAEVTSAQGLLSYNDATRKFLQGFVDRYENWIAKFV